MSEKLANNHQTKLIDLLQAGSIGVMLTDTLYGVVAVASNQAAVRRLYELKHREGKPGTIIAASIDQLVELGVKRRYLQAVASYWPGAVSIVIPVGPELDYLSQGKRTLALRVVSDESVKLLLDKTGALLTSSANQPGEAPAQNIAEAENYFGEEVDFYADGGSATDRQPSTVMRVVDDAVEVLRQGAVPVQEY